MVCNKVGDYQMSRSRKKHPRSSFVYKRAKTRANKAVRKKVNDINYDVGNYSYYKRIFDRYDIFSHSRYFSYRNFCKNFINNKLMDAKTHVHLFRKYMSYQDYLKWYVIK